MLVTSYPCVNPDWGANVRPETPPVTPGICSTSNTSMTQEMISIETTVSETFVSRPEEPSDDYFSTNFEKDIGQFSIEHGKDHLDSSEGSMSPQMMTSRISNDTNHSKEQHNHLPNGNVNMRLPSPVQKLSPVQTRSSSPGKSLNDLGQDSVTGAAHRVTFNDKNEVASQDKDGTFTVTYSQLGEKIVPRQSPDVSEMKKPQTPGLRVQFGETSCLETVELPFKITDHLQPPRNVTFDEDSLLSYKSSKTMEERDNPFQPEGEVSQDADLIIQLWKGGKLTEPEDLNENLRSLALDSIASSETDESDHNQSSEDHLKTNGFSANHNNSPQTKLPVINASDMNYIVMMNNGAEKHKNKIKKHCNLM